MNNELKAEIENQFAQAVFDEETSKYLIVEIAPASYLDLMQTLKTKGFDYLFSMTGMDWGKELGVTNHLENSQTGEMIVVKVKLTDREKPELPTLEKIWKTAHLHEREIYDLFGINFKGHSVMKRLLLSEDWEGYPMRKDWHDETKMIIR